MFVLSPSLTRHRLASLPSRRCGWRVRGQIVCGTWWWYTPAGGKTQRRTSCWESTSPTRTGEKEAGAGLGCTCAVFYTLFALLPAKAVRSAWCCLCGATQRSIWMAMGEFRQCSRPLLHALNQHSRGALCGAQGMTSSCLCTTGASR